METKDLFTKKEDCCGCSMCANQCPRNAIEMLQDNLGFLYPCINEKLCINCEKCIRLCPIKNSGNKETDFVSFYCGSLKDDKDTVSCASGGIATAISRAFISNGGVVYGAAYTEDNKEIVYIKAKNKEGIEKLKTSKYAQANKKTIYKEIEKDLKLGTRVLFVGLPCDVAAIVGVCGKYSNLFTIELICHGPTSQKVHRQYCESVEGKHQSRIIEFSARWKKGGRWTPFYIRAKLENGKEVMIPFHDSPYGAAFRYLKRPSCYSCRFKGNSLQGDLMIGDYHSIEAGMRGYNKHGVSSALVHNDKGQALIDSIDNSFSLMTISEKNAKANRAIMRSIEKPEGQEKYEETFSQHGLTLAYKLSFVKTTIWKRKIRTIVLKFGVKMKRILFPSSKPIE